MSYTPPTREKWIAQITFDEPGFGNYPPRTFVKDVFVDPDGADREGEALALARSSWQLAREWPARVSVYCAEELDCPLAAVRSTYGMGAA
jgi:hypothetical protein